MTYTSIYNSPIGKLTIVSKDNKLIGIYTGLGKNKYIPKESTKENESKEIIIKTKQWLDRYFNGEKPQINELDIEFIGTKFEKLIWQLLCDIPYGELTTYKTLANKVCKIMNKEKMSNQAVGNAIGKNPITIIVPCHRVVGTKGSLTGYSSGLDLKLKLLKHEKIDTKNLYIPKERKTKNGRKNKMQMV